MCQNRVMFKQFLQAGALQFCQIDACRLGGVNEVLSVILMAAKFNGKLGKQKKEFESHHEKTCLRGFQHGKTQTDLLSYRSQWESWNCKYRTADIILSKQRTTKALLRLWGCTGWSAPLLFAYGIIRVFPMQLILCSILKPYGFNLFFFFSTYYLQVQNLRMNTMV